MAQSCDHFDLALEALPLSLGGESSREQHLHCARAPRGQLLREIHRALTAALQLRAEAIALNRLLESLLE